MSRKAESSRGGRPSSYTRATADAICSQVAACIPVHKIAEQPGMPAEGTIYRWITEHAEFREDYTRARERQADRMVGECLAIADEPIDKMGAVERARVRVQVRQWAAERMAPKKYGTRVQQDINAKVEVTDDAEIDRRLASAIAAHCATIDSGESSSG